MNMSYLITGGCGFIGSNYINDLYHINDVFFTICDACCSSYEKKRPEKAELTRTLTPNPEAPKHTPLSQQLSPISGVGIVLQ